MKIFYDLVPLLIFFAAYKWLGIYPATAVAIAASLIQVVYHWVKYKKIDMMQAITCATIFVFGGMTLVLHNAIFIKWKPTIINWVFALVFFVTPYVKKKSLLECLLADKVIMEAGSWKTLNYLWIVFFLVTSLINLYVVYNFTTEQWVNFKVFGLFGLTLIFAVFQAVYISKRARFKAG
jgi:intracellular septation protein